MALPLLFAGCVANEHHTRSVNHSMRPTGDNTPITVESDAAPRYDYNRLRELRARGVNATMATLRRPASGSSVEQAMYDGEDAFQREAGIPRIWPCEHDVSEVISEYGPRSGRHHNGIDIRAEVGTPVMATAEGIVNFSGAMRGYGQIVVIDHGNGIETAYAHLHNRAVQEGDRVEKHQKVGQLGATGNATTPHVHYEVRLDGDPIDPNFFLPAVEGIYLTENE